MFLKIFPFDVTGTRTMTHDDNVVMCGSQSEKSDVRVQENVIGSFRRIFTYADRTSWLLNGIALVAAIWSRVLLPLMDLIFGKFITTFNNFATGQSTPAQFRKDLTWWTMWFIYLFIAKFVFSYIWTFTISLSAIKTTKALRTKFLECTLSQNIAFFDKNELGSISIQVTTNGNLINNGISEKLGLVFQGLSTFVSAFIVAFAVQWKLTLITVCIVPAIIVVTSVCIAIDAKQEARILPLYSQAGALAEEIFSSMNTVQAFWAGPRFSKKYNHLLADAKREGMKKSPNYGVLFSVEYICIYSGYGLAFWQDIRRYADGEIKEPGDIVTVIFAVILASTAMTQIAPQFLHISKAASAADELFKIIDKQSAIDPFSDEGKKPQALTGTIDIRGVHLSYPARPDTPILKGMNLKIPPKKTTALVGSSGCGKSTLVGLLERWYEPSRGGLSLDGENIKDLNLRWLRSDLRVVQQEPVLFHGTIYENVLYGLQGTDLVHLSDEEKRRMVEEACIDAYAHDFIILLPKGYHTILGERASTWSGGQKQRIAIARSIISQPKVLLLDEATSDLDPKAEKIVQQALDRVSSKRTTIVIAHRLSTVRNADNIVVVSDGNVIEQGNHEQLMSLGAAYARLVKAQDLGAGVLSDVQNTQDTALTAVQSTRSRSSLQNALQNTDAEDLKQAFDYNLLKCVVMMVKDQQPLWPHFFIVAIMCVLGGLTFPSQAILFARIMVAFQLGPSQMVKRGDFFALMFFIVAIGNLFVYFTVGWFANIISQVLTYNFRARMFSDVLRQDIEYFDRPENTTGSIVSKLSSYPTQLQELLGFNVALILIILVNLISSCVLALIVGWKLGLVVIFGAMTPLVFAGYLRIRLEFKLDDATSQRFADSAALAAEAVAAIRTVAALTLENNILEMYQDHLRGIERKSTKALLWTMFWYSLTQSISFLAMALGFWYGGTLMANGEYSTQQFFIVFIAVIFSGEAAGQFFSYTTSLTKAQSAANYLLHLRSLEPEIQARASCHHDPDSNDEKTKNSPSQLALKKINFSYPLQPHVQIIHDLSIEIAPGQVTAFVGPSGSGKSTLITLLERYYDPTSGIICFDDRDITTLDPRQYRHYIGLVQQEPVLYQGSIRENISLGLETDDPKTSDIDDACRQANIYDFVSSLPEGLNTLCGSKGTQLSGGQKQRIAIARALICKPRILLLDEATSALDTASERIVQTALEKASTGRTTVAIAHRLSTIKNADKIVVVSAGRIIEEGRHEELIAKGGVYYEMCLAQALDM